MAKRSRITSVDRRTVDATDPPRITRPAPVISDVQKLAIVGVACVFGVLFGLGVSRHLRTQQTALTNAAIKERILEEHRVALEAVDAEEHAITTTALNSDGTAILPPKWKLVIEKAAPIHFIHIKGGFQRLGFVETNDRSEDWKVLWSFRDPFYAHHPSFEAIKAMKPGQKVNQLPGSGWFTYKWYLSEVNPKLKCLPVTFQLPKHREDFLKFAKEHEGEYDWVRKNEGHKGVQAVVPESEAVAKIHNNTLVQQLIRPVLISGRSWDFGIYVAITSSHPLKVYVYDDIVLRFCPNTYVDPVQQPENVGAYVVGDHYTAPWEFPASKKYIDMGYNYMQTLLAVLSEQGHDVDNLRGQLKVRILELLLKMQPKLKGVSDHYQHGASSFFAMYRFDFMLDTKLQPYIMEVNLSPNLSSTRHKPLATLFQNVVNDLVNLIGFGKGGVHRNIELSKDTEVSLYSNDVSKASEEVCEQCYDSECSANEINCVVECPACRTPAQQQAVLEVVSEHLTQGKNWSRIYPVPQELKQPVADYEIPWQPVGDLNGMLGSWVSKACQKDESWC